VTVIAEQFEEMIASASFKDRMNMTIGEGFLEGPYELRPQIATLVAGLSVLVTILGVIFVHLILQQEKKKRERRTSLLPPGPRPWPILGNFPSLVWADRLPHRSLCVLAAKFGGLMYLHLGRSACLLGWPTH
jgi:hypothetical protein